MREYGKVSSYMFERSRHWDDRTFRIAFYLWSGPQTNRIGCFRLPIGYVEDDLNKPDEIIQEVFDRLEKDGFIRYCKATKWVFIKNFLSHNPPERSNLSPDEILLAHRVPKDCSFYEEFCLRFQEFGWEGQ